MFHHRRSVRLGEVEPVAAASRVIAMAFMLQGLYSADGRAGHDRDCGHGRQQDVEVSLSHDTRHPSLVEKNTHTSV